MSDLNNAVYRISQAVRLLAIGEDDVKQRLRIASETLFFVFDDDMPDDLKPQLESIKDRLSKKMPRYKNETCVDATMFYMHKKTAAKIAEDIWKLNETLQERHLTRNWNT